LLDGTIRAAESGSSPGARASGRLTQVGAVAFIALLLVAVSLLLGCGSQVKAVATSAATMTRTTEAPTRATVTIIDEAGRKVTIPDPIKTVYCTGPMGTNLLYMLAPDMMVGWNISPTKLEKKYIPEQYRSVTGLGGWFGKNTTGNVEEIIKRAPDVVLSVGNLDEAAVSEAERVQGLLNIPVIMVDGSLVKSGDSLRYIGKLLHQETRAEELATYCDGVIQEAKTIAATLSDTDKVKVYYAEGGKGLNTDPAGSMHTEVLDLVGGANVAKVSMESDYGMSPVSLEQVLAWDPDVILVASDPAEESNVYQQITTGADWSTIKAVKEKRVYQIPRGPFDWFDRPPSVSRILGIRWLGNLLYPDLYKYDMESEVKAFYTLFYHIDLTDAQLGELMTRAVKE
jgi:iron complex transport system substrate-binding protein